MIVQQSICNFRLIFITLFTLLILTNCKDKSEMENVEQSFEKENYSLSRGYVDILDQLYTEISAKDSNLIYLNSQIEYLNNLKYDSLKIFWDFDKKNSSYYNDLENHLENITDTNLRKKLRNSKKESQATYDTIKINHSKLLIELDKNLKKLTDLQESLKITKTIPLMKSIQLKKLPELTSIQNATNKSRQILNKIDSMKFK